MKRFHVHLSVSHLEDSIRFYSGLFGMPPSVVKDDYAKWMLDDPRVNFAVSTRNGAVTGLNHLGLQAESNDELAQVRERFEATQSETVAETGAHCCYAVSNKHWVQDPEGIPWEAFHTLDSIPVWGASSVESADEDACCTPPTAKSEARRATIAINPARSACCAPDGSKVDTKSCC